jgi:hypothetical protein
VDPALKELYDIARMGGDWREIQDYVSFDFNAIPAIEYYKDDLLTNNQFPNTPEGRVARDEWLEAQDPILIQALAQPLKTREIAKQQAYIDAQKQKVVAEKSAKDQALKQTLYGEKAIKSIGGVEITPPMRESYERRLKAGEVVIKGPNGQVDFDKAVQMLHLYENINTIAKTLMNRAKVSSTKAVLMDAAHVNVTKNPPPIAPATTEKPKSLMERYFPG